MYNKQKTYYDYETIMKRKIKQNKENEDIAITVVD